MTFPFCNKHLCFTAFASYCVFLLKGLNTVERVSVVKTPRGQAGSKLISGSRSSYFIEVTMEAHRGEVTYSKLHNAFRALGTGFMQLG